ncbi:MAG TPA: TIGR02302 family protein [Aliiroseovarius sp.]|nr:TIGR02302 family protein [Aliiroseovarius sp.]
MRKNSPDGLPDRVARRLKYPLVLTRAALWAEAALRAFWLMGTLALFTAAAALAGLFALLPARWSLSLFWALVAGMGLAFILGVLRFQRPRPGQALARIDAGLPGQPLAALTDRQAVGAGDPAARAVWASHRARMAARLTALRPVGPRPDLAPRDPYALRLMALVALAMALGFGTAWRMGDASRLLPVGAADAALAPASWEGWIQPPAYTGRPSLYLADQPPGLLEVPMGSRITLRFYGRLGDITYQETVSGAQAGTPDGQAAGGSQTEPAQAKTSASFRVERDGTLSITGAGDAAWQVVALADKVPTIAPAGAPSRGLNGDFEQAFVARDDYAVASGSARITLDLGAVDRRHGLTIAPEPRAPIRIDLPMPFRGDRTQVEQVLVDNFATHAWANLPVTLELFATDEAGQEGASLPVSLILPGRRFFDPLAKALIEQRRDLLWNRANGARVARLLRAISNRPEGFLDEGKYLAVRAMARRLEGEADAGLSDAARDEVAQGLWDLALSIEDGNLEDARERLRRAQERVAEAMRQGATPEELSELMDELREAMRDFTRQLAQQAQRDGNPTGADQPDRGQQPQGQELSQQDLEDMMDAIEQAMREGRQDDAMAMLQQLQDMMENMQAAEARPGQGDGNNSNEAMQGLADSLTQQQGLSDEAFRDLQEQANPSARTGESDDNVGRNGGRGSGQSHSGEGGRGDGQGENSDLARRQQELADNLDQQRRNLPGAGTEGGDAARNALKDAERAMREAARGLEDGDLAGALDRQAQAMESLREGMRQLDQALAEAQRNRPGQQGANGQASNSNPEDPLGRGPNSRGGLTTDAPLADGQDVYRRAEELMQELRRRSGEPERPAPERDYLRRLLDQF